MFAVTSLLFSSCNYNAVQLYKMQSGVSTLDLAVGSDIVLCCNLAPKSLILLTSKLSFYRCFVKFRTAVLE
jgi:hypothetical protein